jgi:hypothetical protein
VNAQDLTVEDILIASFGLDLDTMDGIVEKIEIEDAKAAKNPKELSEEAVEIFENISIQMNVPKTPKRKTDDESDEESNDEDDLIDVVKANELSDTLAHDLELLQIFHSNWQQFVQFELRRFSGNTAKTCSYLTLEQFCTGFRRWNRLSILIVDKLEGDSSASVTRPRKQRFTNLNSSATMAASDNEDEDDSFIDEDEDDSFIDEDEDGSLIDEDEDGSLIDEEEDGSLIDEDEDEDGSLIDEDEDGSLIDDEEDGSLIDEEEDGSLIDEDKDGSLIDEESFIDVDEENEFDTQDDTQEHSESEI